MGDLAEIAFQPRDPGGQNHKLPLVLASLSDEDAATLRKILASDKNDINWAGVRDEMGERGHFFHVSTWTRWSKDYQRNPGRFGG